ncbi:MAG: AraC family transcriptional regulator [Oscillospiraceae bacterium]|nr:AraC family transcriptional regulator [Oscillospiraceae bacterium]
MVCVLNFLYYHQNIKPEIYISYHKHNFFELVYYEKGAGISNIGGKPFYYKNNTYTIIEPEFSHDEKHLEDTSCIFIGFKYGNKPIKLKNGIYHDDAEFTVLKHLQRMKNEIINKLPHYDLNLRLINQEIIIQHNRTHNSAEHKENKFDRFEYIKNYINNHYSQKINMLELAELSGYSYHHFRHLFKQNSGVSPLNYIINLRIENAKQLLAAQNNTISDIAYSCGFANSSEFGTVFKKIVNMTPSEYRKKNRLYTSYSE